MHINNDPGNALEREFELSKAVNSISEGLTAFLIFTQEKEPNFTNELQTSVSVIKRLAYLSLQIQHTELQNAILALARQFNVSKACLFNLEIDISAIRRENDLLEARFDDISNIQDRIMKENDEYLRKLAEPRQ